MPSKAYFFVLGSIAFLRPLRARNFLPIGEPKKDVKGIRVPESYVNVPLEQWRDQELRKRNLPDHVSDHLLTMARLHAANRYDRLTHDVEVITGRPATSCRDFVARHAELFKPKRP